jgi:hypothetical protein
MAADHVLIGLRPLTEVLPVDGAQITAAAHGGPHREDHLPEAGRGIADLPPVDRAVARQVHTEHGDLPGRRLVAAAGGPPLCPFSAPLCLAERGTDCGNAGLAAESGRHSPAPSVPHGDPQRPAESISRSEPPLAHVSGRSPARLASAPNRGARDRRRRGRTTEPRLRLRPPGRAARDADLHRAVTRNRAVSRQRDGGTSVVRDRPPGAPQTAGDSSAYPNLWRRRRSGRPRAGSPWRAERALRPRRRARRRW